MLEQCSVLKRKRIETLYSHSSYDLTLPTPSLCLSLSLSVLPATIPLSTPPSHCPSLSLSLPLSLPTQHPLQFFFTEKDVGSNCAEVTSPRLAELNRYATGNTSVVCSLCAGATAGLNCEPKWLIPCPSVCQWLSTACILHCDYAAICAVIADAW